MTNDSPAGYSNAAPGSPPKPNSDLPSGVTAFDTLPALKMDRDLLVVREERRRPRRGSTPAKLSSGGVGNLFGQLAMPSAQNRHRRTPSKLATEILTAPDPEDPLGGEIITNALVIKNIPFALKRETLLEMITELQAPAPYAFNYHFDNSVFRGLAFANFHNAEDAKKLYDAVNNLEVLGRKLRVEFKKVEREEEKRNREYERARGIDVDLNDPDTRSYYEQIIAFRADTARAELVFPHTLTSSQRKSIHIIAERAGLMHRTDESEQRTLTVYRREGYRPASGQTTPYTSRPITPATGAAGESMPLAMHPNPFGKLAQMPPGRNAGHSRSKSYGGPMRFPAEPVQYQRHQRLGSNGVVPNRPMYRPGGMASAVPIVPNYAVKRQPRGPDANINFAARLSKLSLDA